MAAALLNGRPGQRALGFVFDIDGVLLLGPSVVPRAAEALMALSNANIPYIFLTNGGGETEAGKAAKVSKLLHVPIHAEQVVMNHTPLRPVARQFVDRRVLILGLEGLELPQCNRSKSGVSVVAESLNLQRAITPRQLNLSDPTIFPALEPIVTPEMQAAAAESTAAPPNAAAACSAATQPGCPASSDDFAAIMVLDDPHNWGLDIQACIDVLNGGHPLGTGTGAAVNAAGAVKQAVPIYATNPDLSYAGQNAAPRLTVGSFMVALNAVWKANTRQAGSPSSSSSDGSQAGSASEAENLVVHQYGKPTKVTFDFAQQHLAQWAAIADSTGWHQHVGVLAAENEYQPTSEQIELIAAAASQYDATNPETDPESPTLESSKSFDRILMVGDNPAADIRGANNAGPPWVSVLVRTGLFKGPKDGNDVVDPARVVVDDAWGAVQYGLSLLTPAR